MKAGVSEGRKFWGRRQGFSQRWMGGLGGCCQPCGTLARLPASCALVYVAQRKLVYTSYVLRRKLAHAVRRP